MKNSKNISRTRNILAGLLLGSLMLFLLSFKRFRSGTRQISSDLTSIIHGSKFAALYPYIVAMAKYETANFTSRVYTAYNNLFGMKQATARRQLGRSIPETPYRVYEDPAQSLEDFLIYLDYVNFPVSVENVEDYIYQLKKRSYFTDSEQNYLNGVKKYL